MHTTSKILTSFAALAVLTSGAMAADLARPVKAAPAIAAPAASTWEGAYIGGNVGYAWGHSDNVNSDDEGDFDLSGGSIGGQIGYNFQLSDSLVLGVQGDLQWANVTGDYDDNHIIDTINWDGAVVARLGLDAGQFMPYVLGGVAFANSTRTPSWDDADTETHTGWTVGAGVEAKVSDQLSAFVEYRYADYGQETYNFGDDPVVDLTSSSVRAGVNFHF